MKQEVEGIYSVRIELPDVLYAGPWQTFAAISREEQEEALAARQFRQALAIIEGGEFTVNGKTYDLKATPLEQIPVAVMRWVGQHVVIYVQEQFVIEKNSSAPSSEPQKQDSTTG